MSLETGERRRIQFRAPEGLIERTDVLASVLETDRTDVIISALREYLRSAAHDDDRKQELAAAYYDDEIAFEQLKELLGHEEAANVRVLKTQLSEEFLDAAADELVEP